LPHSAGPRHVRVRARRCGRRAAAPRRRPAQDAENATWRIGRSATRRETSPRRTPVPRRCRRC